MKDFLAIAERFGVPTAFCAVLCVAIYLSVSWTADKVAVPLVKTHIEFLETEQESMKAIAGAATKQAESMIKQASQMEEHTRLLQEISEAAEGTKAINKQIRDDQRKFPAISEKTP